MKYLLAFYRHLKNETDIYLEAAEEGLELRLDTFFYDPKTRMYRDEYRDRIGRERFNFNKAFNDIGGDIDSFNCKFQMLMAGLFYYLFHPRKTIRSGVFMIGSKKSHTE